MLLAATLVSLMCFYLAVQKGAWQLFGAGGGAACGLLASLVDIRFIRRGRYGLGAQWLIAGLGVGYLIFNAAIDGLGLVLALFNLLLAAMIAGRLLISKPLARTLIISAIFSLAIVVTDWLAPPYRLAVAELQALVPLVMALMALVYGSYTISQFNTYSLQTKLMLTFLTVTLIPLALLTYWNVQNTRKELTYQTNQSLLNVASQTATTIDTLILTNLDVVRTQAQLPDFVDYLDLPDHRRPGSELEAEVIKTLEVLARRDSEHISSYALLDSQGLAVLDTLGEDTGQNEADRDYFQKPLQTGQPYASPVEYEPTPGEVSLYFSAPVRSEKGEFLGVLRVRYQARILQDIVTSVKKLSGQIITVVFDENYLRLAHSSAPDLTGKLVAPLDPMQVVQLQANYRLPAGTPQELSTHLSDLAADLANAEIQPLFTTKVTILQSSELALAAVAKTKTQPWLVGAFQPQSAFLANVNAQTNVTILLVFLISGLVTGVAFGIAKFLTGPITRLTGLAQQITAGDLALQAPVDGNDETAKLAQAFNSMTAQLRRLIDSLEDQVHERTSDLAFAMEVGQRASTIKDLPELLPTITALIAERFNLYYTQVYFSDDLGQNLILKASSGTAGQVLLAQGDYIPIGPGSIVGAVAATGKSILVAHTETSDLFISNVLLPETQSELAVPLQVEGQVIGVLDMQANRPNAFGLNNLTVFEVMATQLAIVIDSARQFAAAQAAQRKAEEALQRLSRESWAEKLATRKGGLGFAYDLATLKPIAPHASQSTSLPHHSLAVPLVVQNQPIGQLAVTGPTPKKWSEEEHIFVNAVAQQLAQKAENLRLFEQTQQRAAREQLARHISDKVRASRDIDSALKTAAEELTKALGAARAVVNLRTASGKELDQ
jgi:GAF domain-containing protein/HAMP domain-containing protein